MKKAQVAQAASLLAGAWRSGKALDALPEACRPATLAEGYAIQAATAKALGEKVAGWKVGATGAMARKLLKARAPFAGRVYASRVLKPGATIPSDAHPMRGLEAEIAFRLGRDLPPRDRPYTMVEVKRAIASVHPAVEIVSTRWTEWLKVGLPSVAADHGANGALVVGRPFAPGVAKDVDRLAVEMHVDGQVVGKGTGADVIGGPHASLLWLANMLRRRGGLKAGEYVSTGTCTGLVKAEPKARVEAFYAGRSRIAFSFG
ncbi:MAG: hydratase [Alphaproteobacteria bacterium]|nr:hydratase [Alphaproteobacteria bacterium]